MMKTIVSVFAIFPTITLIAHAEATIADYLR